MKPEPLRTVLPADLVREIEAECVRRRVPIERFVEEALLYELPRLWAVALHILADRTERGSNMTEVPG